jgi:hypothetical protein
MAVSLGADTMELSFAQHAASNVFQTRYAERDWISALEFTLVKDLRGVSLLAGAAMDYSSPYQELGFSEVRGGVDGVVAIGGKSGLYLSATAAGSFYRDIYRDFNNVSLEAFAAFKTYASQSSIIKANSEFEYKKYASAVFDFASGSLALSLDNFFPTNTTVKVEAGWGYKYFLHPFTNEVVSGTTERVIRGGGPGNGPVGPGAYPASGASGGGQGIQSLSVSGLLAQSIGRAVGLSLSWTRQWTVSGRSPFLTAEEAYLEENPTYDRFVWEGWGLSCGFAAQIFRDIEVKVGYTVSAKTFPGMESMSLEGASLGITREDRRKKAEVRIERDFRRFSIFLTGAYVDNRSSAPLFDWNGTFISGGIQWNIPFGKQ